MRARAPSLRVGGCPSRRITPTAATPARDVKSSPMSPPAPRPTLSDVPWRPPVIETERLVLRGYEPTDAPGILRYASDPEVTRFMAWDPCRNLDDVNGFLNGAIAPHYQACELD